MTHTEIAFVFSVISILLCVFALVFSFAALVDVWALKRSTHKVQYMPLPTDFMSKADKALNPSQEAFDWDDALKEDQ